MTSLEYASHHPLFNGIKSENVGKMLNCSNAEIRKFTAGEIIIEAGGEFHNIGIIISGSVHIMRIDDNGNRFILSQLVKDDFFGMSLTLMDLHNDDVFICAASDCEVLMIGSRRLIYACECNCTEHKTVLQNALTILTNNNIALVRKLCHVSQRTTRLKILSYLNEQASLAHSAKIKIPFDRQGMADYLGVDRSALSAELSKMKKEGVIDFRKNSFTLKQQ